MEDFGRVKDEWETPPDLANRLITQYNLTTDVACTEENRVCKWRLTDSLNVVWPARCYCNPPYSNWRPWVEKAHQAVFQGYTRIAVLLLPVDTSTKAFHEYIWDTNTPKPGAAVEFLPKRLRFYYKGKPGPYPARFASMIVVFKR